MAVLPNATHRGEPVKKRSTDPTKHSAACAVDLLDAAARKKDFVAMRDVLDRAGGPSKRNGKVLK
jgi:hypothetical protein